MPLYAVTAVIFFIIGVQDAVCHQRDYYWREYTGSVPEDAIVGGQDINGKDIYIGQAYVRNEGLIPVQISAGVRQVHAPIRGVKNVDTYTKVLCGPQQNFLWTMGNRTDLHLLLIDKHAVLGGHEDGGGILNVGRISHENEVKIGNAYFYFSNKGKEQRVDSYEILLYHDNNVDVRFKPSTNK